nr:MAG TPA: hypothetical protein [Caudoviricetes sp.]
MEFFKNVYDDIKNEIEPYKPKMAKILEFTFVPFIIAVVSILCGAVASLIIRSFTDHRPVHMMGLVLWFALISFIMYGLLHAIRAYQLYAGSGILNDPKYVVVVEKHKDWLLRVSTSKFAFRLVVDTLIVSIIFLAFDFEIKVQIGSWISAIDSRAFVIAALGIHCWSAWEMMAHDIKCWVKCREHIFNRFGV